MALPTMTPGRSLGQAFGTGLGEGIRSLTQTKLAEMAQHKRATALNKLGLGQELSGLVSQFPDELQYKVLENLGFPGMFGQGTPPFGVQPQQRLMGSPKQIEKQQEYINKSLANYFKTNEAAESAGEEVYESVQKALDLVNSGKVASGVFGENYDPRNFTALQNDATQQFVKEINKLIVQNTALGKGLPSKFRLALESAAKPQLQHSTATQKELLSQLVRRAQKAIFEGQAIKELQGKYGYHLPQNFKELVKSRKEELMKAYRVSGAGNQIGQVIDSTNDNAAIGTLARDEKGNQMVKSSRGWIKL
jgi:hypothetical protein